MTTSPQRKTLPVLIHFAALKIACLCFVVLVAPASVPSSVNACGPHVLTGPKASGLDKQLVSASICSSVQGSEVSRRNGTAMLQFQGEKKYKAKTILQLCREPRPVKKSVSYSETTTQPGECSWLSDLRLWALTLFISEGYRPQIRWQNVARSTAVNCSTFSLRLRSTPEITALIWEGKEKRVLTVVCRMSPL